MSEKLDKLIQSFEELVHEKELYLKFPENFVIPRDPKTFLYNFLTEYNGKYLTYNKQKEKEGWFYPHAQLNLRRSVNEVYSIIKYYFPNYTILQYFSDIYDVIYQIFKNDQTIICHYCGLIQRSVFLVNSDNYRTFLKEGYLDPPHHNFYSFGWKPSQGFWSKFVDLEIFKELTGDKYTTPINY